MTDPEYWFTSSDQLGPWDWKISVIRERDIAYGKFLGGAAGFATTEFYRHMMNYRRSLPQYRIVLGEDFHATKQNEILMKVLAPVAFNLIKERGAVESREIRESMTSAVSLQLLDSVTESCRANLAPTVKKASQMPSSPSLKWEPGRLLLTSYVSIAARTKSTTDGSAAS